jgi:pimeloyl-ACP methyl ester carboxylesterase
MLGSSKRAGKPDTQESLEPDRSGSIRGLSLSGFHELAYVDWGPSEAEIPVVCLHGLSRQGRDFDYLASYLAATERRVVCPDLVGRGRSGRLRDANEYALPQYCADINALVAHLGAKQVDLVGTSLGGLIGIVLAGQPGTPIRRLVVNDIGPYLPWPGLVRIGSYLSSMPADFDGLEEVEAYLRKVLAPFGDLPDEHWTHLARHSVAWHAERERYVMLCDPQIVRAFRNPWHYSINLWKYWTGIKGPIFVLRGAKSDLLTADLAREMERRSLFARIHEIEGCGHAPPLMSADQIKLVSDFLSSQRSFA